MSYTLPGLTPAEGNELQAQLDPGEWQALLTLQQLLHTTPLAAPDAGFSNRVLSRLAARERARALRRNILGASAFGLGSMLLTALLIWSSPLGALTQAAGWVTLLDGVAFVVSVVTTLFLVTSTFAQALWYGDGRIALMLVALFAVSLTLIWTYMITRPALSSRLIRAMEAN
ncbi:MAG: hypothetical protein WCF84_08485 [Anaerolineae bacterium]